MTTGTDGPSTALCPSARCVEGARLLGIVRRDGTVAFTPEDIRVDGRFVEAAGRGRAPESRFRFAGPCRRTGCGQWTNERCGIVDSVLEHVARTSLPVATALPDCSIRPRCRWFLQSGEQACRVCPLVVTEAGVVPIAD